MKRVSLACILIGCMMGPLSCIKYTTPVVSPPAPAPAERNFQRLWQASEGVLRDYRFTVDRRDRRAGIITTEPMVAPQWFEFWRKDSVGAIGKTESTLQTIYRVAEVKISPTAEGADTFQPAVRVLAYRSDRENPQVTNTSEAYSLFHVAGGEVRPASNVLLPEEIPAEEFEDEQPPTEEFVGLPDWLVPVGEDGRDHKLEEVLTARIRAAAGL